MTIPLHITEEAERYSMMRDWVRHARTCEHCTTLFAAMACELGVYPGMAEAAWSIEKKSVVDVADWIRTGYGGCASPASLNELDLTEKVWTRKTERSSS